MKGKYICLEGPDGGGKTTLARAICQRLASQGVNALRYWFPSDNAVGSLIRQGLRGETKINQKAYLYLFAADGLQANAELEACLAMGHHVVCDRHPTLSGLVFQPDHHTQGQIESVYGSASIDGVIKPDHLFIIDVPADVTLARMRSREKYKDVVFESDRVEKVDELRQRYLKLVQRTDAILLDGTRPTEDLVTNVLHSVGL